MRHIRPLMAVRTDQHRITSGSRATADPTKQPVRSSSVASRDETDLPDMLRPVGDDGRPRPVRRDRALGDLLPVPRRMDGALRQRPLPVREADPIDRTTRGRVMLACLLVACTVLVFTIKPALRLGFHLFRRVFQSGEQVVNTLKEITK